MFHPVGSRRAAVYWRRRALLVAAVALLAMTVWVLAAGGSGKPTAHHSTPPSTSPSVTVRSTPSSVASSTSVSSSSASGSGPGSSSAAASAPCSISRLRISAVPGAASYGVGAKPVVMLQVINPGPLPCVQDLADAQVELLVYNGESRVWGSHDCEIQPGIDLRTLPIGQAVRVSVTWSGLSSQPSCTGTRQRVGAGTYTLYAKLAGQTGTAAQFTIT